MVHTVHLLKKLAINELLPSKSLLNLPRQTTDGADPVSQQQQPPVRGKRKTRSYHPFNRGALLFNDYSYSAVNEHILKEGAPATNLATDHKITYEKLDQVETVAYRHEALLPRQEKVLTPKPAPKTPSSDAECVDAFVDVNLEDDSGSEESSSQSEQSAPSKDSIKSSDSDPVHFKPPEITFLIS